VHEAKYVARDLLSGLTANPVAISKVVDILTGMPAATSRDLGRAATLFHALSDETRLGILERLGEGEQCVCDLQQAFATGQSRLSYHLKVLKDAGLVTDRKDGRWSYYALAVEALGEAHDAVRRLATEGPGQRRKLKVFGGCCG
jgi:ArsR family transcriptional regulator